MPFLNIKICDFTIKWPKHQNLRKSTVKIYLGFNWSKAKREAYDKYQRGSTSRNILAADVRADLKAQIVTRLEEINNNFEAEINQLYQRNLILPNTTQAYVNLQQCELTESQQSVLALGLKCHYKGKFDITAKEVELVLLYNLLVEHHEKECIAIKPD